MIPRGLRSTPREPPAPRDRSSVRPPSLTAHERALPAADTSWAPGWARVFTLSS